MQADDLLQEVKLRYSTDNKPGYSRKVQGNTFHYFDQHQQRITDPAIIERINKLVIPPAYTNVWICPFANGYLQATGYDARKRKQYRYHPLWIEVSQKEKFTHMIEFAHHLPKIRQKLTRDMALDGMPRAKVIAAVVWLLEHTLIRIGNEEYEKENKSYGLTTLKNRHVEVVDPSNITFRFKGKSGIHHNVSFKNKKIVAIVKRCKELPGQDLFEYTDDDGTVQSISSSDVNEYLQEISGTDITAKDFRTWGGTIMAATVFDSLGVSEDEKLSKKNIMETIQKVANHLRNKPSTSKKYYIHPSIIDAYSKGYVLSNLKHRLQSKKRNDVEGLRVYENNVLVLLEHMLSVEKNVLRQQERT